MPNWEKRAENRLHSTHLLKVAGINFTEHNNGAHLKIGEIDFWPGTGLFKEDDIEGRGVENLIEYIKSKKSNTFVMKNRQHECPCCGASLILTITKQEK